MADINENTTKLNNILTRMNELPTSSAGGSGGIADIQEETMNFYEGYGTTLTYRLLDGEFSGSLPNTTSTYIVECIIMGELQVDSSMGQNFEYHLKGMLKDGAFTRIHGYQKLKTYNLDYYGAEEEVSEVTDSIDYSDEYFSFWPNIYAYNADMSYDYLNTTYAKMIFIKLN